MLIEYPDPNTLPDPGSSLPEIISEVTAERITAVRR